jgi:hypothetical protein
MIREDDVMAELFAQRAAITMLMQALTLMADQPPEQVAEAFRFRLKDAILTGTLHAPGLDVAALRTRALLIADQIVDAAKGGGPGGGTA